MKKAENKILIIFVVLVSLFFTYKGFEVYQSKQHMDKYEMVLDDINIQTESEEVLYIAELKNFKEGQYTINFDYDASKDVYLKIYSLAAYDYKTDNFPVFYEEIISAGKGTLKKDFAIDDYYQAVTITATTDGNISIENCNITGSDNFFADRDIYYYSFVLFLMFFMALSIYVILKEHNRKDKYISLIILIGLIVVSVMASRIYAFTNYSTYGCDTKFHLYRTKAIAESMANGNLPNRINGMSYFGYGYANPLLYPELFLYIPAFWINKGMSDLGAMKLFYILLNVVAVVIAYYSFEKICKNKYISFSATTIYTLSFYKLLNIYVRTALGETLFMTFLPLAVYALYTLFYEKRPRWLLLAIVVSCIFQSHILGTVLTCMLLGCLFVFFSIDLIINKSFRLDIIINLVKAVLWTILANIWFIVPFINAYFNYGLVMFDRETMVTWFFNELLSARAFLSPVIAAGEKNVFSSVGVLVLVGLIGALVFSVISLIKSRQDRIIVLGTGVATVLFGVISTDIINWSKVMEIKLFKVIFTTLQFSFRFEALFVMALCFVIVFAFRNLKSKHITVLSMLFALIVIVASVPNMNEFEAKANYGKIDNTYRSYGVDEPLEYLKPEADVRKEILREQKVTKSENITLLSYNKDGINIDFSVDNGGAAGWIQFPLFYYDDYSATTESGENLKVYSGDRALLFVEIPENLNNENVSIRFGQSPMYTVPLYISIIFVIFTLIVCVYNRYKKDNLKES